MPGCILYITFDGVLQPLGFSQVVRVVAGLASRGWRYHLLSVERTRDLLDANKVAHVRSALGDVEWSTVGVDLAQSVRTSAQAFTRVLGKALALVRDTTLIHARGYQAAAVAHAIHTIRRIPYLFDARGCWIDERPDWFSRPAAYALGKWVERDLYRDACAVVTLTELHRRDVVDGAFGRKDPSAVVTIPTCADYDEFRIHPRRPQKPADFIDPVVANRLSGKNVVAIVGSLNRSYFSRQTIELARKYCERSTDNHLLILTEQQAQYADLLDQMRFPGSSYTLTAAAHRDMPRWMDWIDWSILLLPDVAAKRGSMPTKLAEFFASGVRVVAHGCNAEMTSWVRRAGSGVTLEDVSDEHLSMAADSMMMARPTQELEAARAVTAPHFSLSCGLDRYSELLRAIA